MNINNICFGCMNQIESGVRICPICGYDRVESKKRQTARCLKPGTLLKKTYLIGKVLGEGGFGITYIAKNIQNGEILAVKEYFPSELAYRDIFSSDGNEIFTSHTQNKEYYEIGLKNFKKEAKSLLMFKQLDGIVQVKDYFEANHSAYIVMEYVKGISLKNYLKKRKKPLNEKQVLKMMKPVFCALDKIHKKNIIHRDISPENIILDRSGKVKLIDFGAARMATGEETKSFTVLLKHGYAPIEQYQSRGRQGPFTDIYALCATMYELMSMKVPKRSIERAKKDTTPTLKELARKDSNIRVSAAVSDVIQKGMEINSEQRYQDIESLCRALYQREDWKKHTKTVNLPGIENQKNKKEMDSNTRRFLQEQKRYLEYERQKEEIKKKKEREKETLEREKQKKLQEELEWKREQEILKKEYERQEQRKKKRLEEQKKQEIQKKLQEQEEQKKRLREQEEKRRLQEKSSQVMPSQSNVRSNLQLDKRKETKRKKKKKRNRDLWYSEYEQQGLERNVVKKRNLLLFFGALSLFLCIGVIILLSRRDGENKVAFGTYPQNEITGSAITDEIREAQYDSNKFATVNGKRYRRAGQYFYVFDEIEWKILAREEGKMLLVSQDILDAQAFSALDETVTSWEDSFIRKWLNTYFYDAAFSEEEKAAIVERTIVTETVDSEEVETQDKVFLLSTAEVQDRGYYFTGDEERIAKKSVYALRRGAQTGGENSGRWWLRTPGSRENTVQVVRANGSLAENSYTVLSNDCGVRPAIWVDETYFEE